MSVNLKRPDPLSRSANTSMLSLTRLGGESCEAPQVYAGLIRVQAHMFPPRQNRALVRTTCGLNHRKE